MYTSAGNTEHLEIINDNTIVLTDENGVRRKVVGLSSDSHKVTFFYGTKQERTEIWKDIPGGYEVIDPSDGSKKTVMKTDNGILWKAVEEDDVDIEMIEVKNGIQFRYDDGTSIYVQPRPYGFKGVIEKFDGLLFFWDSEFNIILGVNQLCDTPEYFDIDYNPVSAERAHELEDLHGLDL